MSVETSPLLAETIFTFLSTQSWESLSFAALASRLDVEESDLVSAFPFKESLIAPLIQKIDTDTLKAFTEEDHFDSSLHDVLFDFFMCRFDALAPYRDGALELAQACRRHSALAQEMLHAQNRFFEKAGALLTDAKIIASHHHTQLRLLIPFLPLLYFLTFRVWEKDSSIDLAKTMAFLDKAIQKACFLSGFK